ncbi:MAG: glucosyl transferase [Ignavibacterium album]|nr:glucosyl transferase [Ignavibacterium album]
MKATMPLLILIIQTLLFTTGCKQSTEPKLEAVLKLELEDASCTEAWIKLSTANLQFPATINLLKDGNVAQTISLWRDVDTVLYVDSLLPNQTYRFKSIVQSSNQQIITSSNELTVTTMDTTSHEFSWQSWEFGTTGSSTLYDVAIINENDIWAVGEINIADTSINGYTTYNAVHWDGTKWELKRIQFYTFCGQQDTGSYPAKSVFAFGHSDVWIAMDGSQVVRWNGISQSQPICTPVSINKLWGSSSENLYAVGNNGNIAHWDGRKWTKIESGTGVDINDVFGVIDPTSNSQKVFCAVSFVLQLGELKILTIGENNKVDSLRWNTGRRVGSIWSNKGRIVYTSGGGVFHNKIGYWVEETAIPLYYTNRIRGNGLNDIFAVGDFALLAHFNGIHWNVHEEFLRLPATSFNSITVKGNIIAIVGYSGEKALIITGKRN